MFEAFCGFLLRLYPSAFRHAYGHDAQQLIRDRARHERGVLPRLRLVIDLTMDLLSTLVTWQPAVAVHVRVDGTPRFDVIEAHRPHPAALMAGMLTSALMVACFALLVQPRTFPSPPAQLGEGSEADPTAFEPSSDSAQQVVASDASGRQSPIATVGENLEQRYVARNCLFQTIETLPNNISYVKLNGFGEAAACHEITKRAMASVNNAAALIVDLRDSGGGFDDTALQIAGYLFDRPTYFYDPRPHSPVASHTAPVPGSRLVDKPVFVLTSSRTQSAAEYFVINLKMLKRATIIGEKTAGDQHSGAFVGVEPDVKVSRDEALEVAKQLAGSEIRRQ